MDATATFKMIVSSTNSGPLLKENDVSGRAGKPIYAEEQCYDSQTQRTEQATVFCAAVRTELKTASASTEEQTLASDPKSSSHSEAESILTNQLSYSTPCYNKFLQFYNLPILDSSQTIESFLTYIQENYPSYYSPKFIKISIYTDKSLDYKEAHIYVPCEPCPLHNYSLLPFEDLYYCAHILLKSHTDSNPDNIPTTTNLTSLVYNNVQLLEQSNTKDLHLTIATHNVRGFNIPAKR